MCIDAMQLKERQKEDHLYENQEKFITSAYRRKLEDDNKWQESQRLKCVEMNRRTALHCTAFGVIIVVTNPYSAGILYQTSIMASLHHKFRDTISVGMQAHLSLHIVHKACSFLRVFCAGFCQQNT